MLPPWAPSRSLLFAAGLLALAMASAFAYFSTAPTPPARPPGVEAAPAAMPAPGKSAASDERNRRPVTEFRRVAGQPSTYAAASPPVQTPPPRPAPAPPARAESRLDLPMTIAVWGEAGSPPSLVSERSAEAPGAEPPPTGGNGKPVRRIGERFLPFGEPLKCQTVFAVSSDSTDTPVVGVVTEDRYFNGALVIPKGTKVHTNVGGLSGPPRARKLRTADRWTIVLPEFADIPNGAELVIRATALNRAETGPGAWAVADGDGGLRGETIYDPSADRVRQFLAAFLSSAASGLQSSVNVAVGNGTTGREVDATPRNAALGGVSTVLASEVSRIQEEIRANGAYVFVPSGTTFYLYPLQTMDVGRARVGDSAAFVRGAESDFYDRHGRRRDEFPAEPPAAALRQPAETGAMREPVPVPAPYGRAPYFLTRPAPDGATPQSVPQP